jgi:hypothetical protein
VIFKIKRTTMKVVFTCRRTARIFQLTVYSFSLLTFGLLVAPALNAQRIDRGGARNAIYAEASSFGPGAAIHYDRIFRQGEKIDYSISAGFSVWKNSVSFPVGLHLMTTNSEHHAGFGITLIPSVEYKDAPVGSTGKGDRDKYLYINPGFSYRYQKSTAGLFFQATAGPSIFLDPPSDDFWNMDPKLHAFASVGLGISF